ncbi:TonB family protein [Zhouia sp. PK063]|uniref:TonB family protein n=1 Tax=Zhouia sp. PK063 TaxID=3373602 RepID=UPI0037A17577
MLHYLLQTIVFQLLFLVVYDFFLKKETFFKWNRFYLVITPLLSLVVPLIKLDSFKNVVPAKYIIVLPEVILSEKNEFTYYHLIKVPVLNAWEWVALLGCFVSLFLFFYKLFKIDILEKSGKVERLSYFTQIRLYNSDAAFSFFNKIFLGDKILEKDHAHILKHELVHVEQRHSYDLMLFEVFRILFWFNPLVYIYQKRIAELHEFLADAKVMKQDKKQHYQYLLSEVFKTEEFSFVNQFYNHSLIKKRIVMLQKTKSKNIWQLKYLILVPAVCAMLLYTSCESESNINVIEQENLTTSDNTSSIVSVVEKKNEERVDVPFSVIEQVPIFPGCESAVSNADKRECFQSKIVAFVQKNFHYPEVAQKQKIQGRVAIMFTIGKEGVIKEIKARGPSSLLENEAVSIIEKLPKMQPGMHNGKAVNVPFSLPINFRLQ